MASGVGNRNATAMQEPHLSCVTWRQSSDGLVAAMEHLLVQLERVLVVHESMPGRDSGSRLKDVFTVLNTNTAGRNPIKRLGGNSHNLTILWLLEHVQHLDDTGVVGLC